MKNWYAIMGMILFISCSNESEIGKEDLVGIWATNPGLLDVEIQQVTTYDFRNDGSLEILTFHQTVDDEVLGFRYRAMGTYSVSSNHLLMHMEPIFLNDDTKGDFVESLDELVLSQQRWVQTVKISFNETATSLTFDYGPCNDTSNCIGSQVLTRVDQ